MSSSAPTPTPRSAADVHDHDAVASSYFERWEQPIAPRVLLAGAAGGRELEALLPLDLLYHSPDTAAGSGIAARRKARGGAC